MTRISMPLSVVMVVTLILSLSLMVSADTVWTVPGKNIQNTIEFRFNAANANAIDAARVNGALYFVPVTQSGTDEFFSSNPQTLVSGGGMKQTLPVTVKSGTPPGTYSLTFNVVDATGAPVKDANGNPITVTIEIVVVDRTHTGSDGFYRPDTIVTNDGNVQYAIIKQPDPVPTLGSG
ncbi:MAG TPA: hypothetical protein VN372_01865 [Methanospirillum sp.]|nr:hypothetical protein [Methanospirillum sp.]